MNKRNIKTMARQAVPPKDVKNFIPCDPALNLCRDCSKKIAEGTCPKLPSDMVTDKFKSKNTKNLSNLP